MKNHSEKIIKLLLITPHNYKKLLLNSKKSVKKEEEQFEIGKILKNKDLKDTQKLFMIHEILRMNANQQQLMNANQNDTSIKNIATTTTQTDLVEKKDQSTEAINNNNRKFYGRTSTPERLMNDEEINTSNATSSTSSEAQNTSTPSSNENNNSQSVYTVGDSESFESFNQNNDDNPRNSSIYNNDDNELNLSQEQESFMKHLKDATGHTDLRGLKFFNLSKDDTSYVNAIDKQGYRYHMPKPSKFVQDLETKRKKGTIKKRSAVSRDLRSKELLNPSHSIYNKPGKDFNVAWKNYESIRLFPRTGK